MKIAMLGSGFIARFYATSLHAQRRTDQIISVYSRNLENAKRFANDFEFSIFSDNMEEIINHPEVDVVLISLPNHLHELAVAAAAKAKKHVLCTKPLGRTAEEGKRMLDLVEKRQVYLVGILKIYATHLSF